MAPALDIQVYPDERYDHRVTSPVKPLPATMSDMNSCYKPRPSLWKPLRHPRYLEVSREVDEYFLTHWTFSDAKAKIKFLSADFSNYTCLHLPLAKDDRIHFACRLVTVLFLIDGKLAPN